MDQNSSAVLKPGARARNGAAKTANSKARSANGHAIAPELNQHELLNALHAMQAGDFSVRLPGHQTGVAGKICDAFNTITPRTNASRNNSSMWAKWWGSKARRAHGSAS